MYRDVGFCLEPFSHMSSTFVAFYWFEGISVLCIVPFSVMWHLSKCVVDTPAFTQDGLFFILISMASLLKE